MRLSDLFNEGNIETGFAPADKNSLLASIVRNLEGKGFIGHVDRVITDVIEREKVMSTGIGNGVAIPHAYTDGVDRLVAGFYRTSESVDFQALDNEHVDLFFIILGPKDSRRDHIKVLAKISRLLNHDDFREDLRKAPDAEAVMGIFRRFGDK